VFNIDLDKFSTNYKRLLYIVSYIKGTAFEFIEPYLEDYLENVGNFVARKEGTRRVLSTDKTLFDEIKAIFG